MLQRVNESLRNGCFESAISGYIDYFTQYPALIPSLIGMLHYCQQKYSVKRNQEFPTVAVSCWNTANNALGRAATLADGYRRAGFTCNVIGCVPFPHWHKVWQPLVNSRFEPLYFELAEHHMLLSSALKFVLAHPYDVIHLSKPRIPNIVLGLLYQQIWGSKVIIDVDDEELGFVNFDQRLADATIEALIERLLPLKVDSAEATLMSVKSLREFSDITVSNPALRLRYGGITIPHLRNERDFVPSSEKALKVRARMGIPLDKKVVLFAGTPRAHKGLLETAKALSSLKRDDYIFVVVGNFIDKALLQHLTAIEHLRLLLLPDQPYDAAHDTVALGDIVVLMQNRDSEAASFQLPAKLIDALAMGLTILMAPTPATQFIVDTGMVRVTTEASLAADLEIALDQQCVATPDMAQHSYFVKYLSTGCFIEKFKTLALSDRQELRKRPSEKCLTALVNNDLTNWLKSSLNF